METIELSDDNDKNSSYNNFWINNDSIAVTKKLEPRFYMNKAKGKFPEFLVRISIRYNIYKFFKIGFSKTYF